MITIDLDLGCMTFLHSQRLQLSTVHKRHRTPPISPTLARPLAPQMLTCIRFPLRAQLPPPLAPQARTLEQDQPHVDFSGDFEAPEDIKGPVQFALFDFFTCKPSANIECGDIADGMARRQAGRLCGIVVDGFGWTNAA